MLLFIWDLHKMETLDCNSNSNFKIKNLFTFSHFSLHHERSTLKIGTDSVLLGALTPLKNIYSVLDIGCGCGIIAFCIGYRLSVQSTTHRQKIIGIDCDQESIQEAEFNLAQFPKGGNQHYEFHCEKIQDYAPFTSEMFDLIVSNPPYFHNSLKPENPQKIASKHGDRNLSYDELIDCSLQLLNPTGSLSLILPTAESIYFKKSAENKLYLKQEIEIKPTIYKAVNRNIMTFTKQSSSLIDRQTLCIRDGAQQYTEEYQRATRDFYLAFSERT